MTARRYLTAEEERTLIAQAQAGDLSARDRVILNIMPLLYREANRLTKTRPHLDSEDLVQGAVARIVAKFHHFDLSFKRRFSTYFGEAAKREMRRELDRNGVVRSMSNPHHLSPDTVNAYRKHSGPLLSLNAAMYETEDGREVRALDILIDHREIPNDAHRERLASSVHQCLERIPERYRDLITRRYLQGQTLHSIGAVYGCSRENIRAHLLEAMRWVKQILLSDPIIREYVTDHGNPAKAITGRGPVKTRTKRKRAEP